MKKLSVVIITFNEAENIGKCIGSVKQVADEIVVVDSFSTDNTKAIAIAAGARFIERKFEGHIEQKNFARKQAANDWVLSLDADESLSYELLAQVISWKNEPEEKSAAGYYMNRLNFYCGKPIKFIFNILLYANEHPFLIKGYKKKSSTKKLLNQKLNKMIKYSGDLKSDHLKSGLFEGPISNGCPYDAQKICKSP